VQWLKVKALSSSPSTKKKKERKKKKEKKDLFCLMVSEVSDHDCLASLLLGL
jgi:hypothetical protein